MGMGHPRDDLSREILEKLSLVRFQAITRQRYYDYLTAERPLLINVQSLDTVYSVSGDGSCCPVKDGKREKERERERRKIKEPAHQNQQR